MAKKARKKARPRKAAPGSAKKATRRAKSAGSRRRRIDLREVKKALTARARQPRPEGIAAAEGMDPADRLMAAIDQFCADGGCGPDMVFPPPPPNNG